MLFYPFLSAGCVEQEMRDCSQALGAGLPGPTLPGDGRSGMATSKSCHNCFYHFEKVGLRMASLVILDHKVVVQNRNKLKAFRTVSNGRL
jgi:hypothetical protein